MLRGGNETLTVGAEGEAPDRPRQVGQAQDPRAGGDYTGPIG